MLGRIANKLAGRSIGDVAGLVSKNVVHAVRNLTPAAAATRRVDGAFDARWGTETSRLVNLGDLSLDRARARHGVRYQPSNDALLAQVVAAFALDPSEWSMVDYGSGKGRVVLTAAAMKFRRAIGIEFSPELFRIAEANGRSFMAKGGADRAPEFVLGDAGAYEPPAGPLLAYLYNPFGPVVLDEVIARLETTVAVGDPVLVAYVDPRHLDRFEGRGRWTDVTREPGVALLRAG